VARELEGELRKAGWWGKRVLKDGRVVRLGSAHRIKTILRTNMHTAYAAGRYRQQKEGAAARPWWRYVAIQDNATRLAHRQLHGKILRHDDPAWEAIYPPNGFNCRCRVATMTEEQASRAADGDRIDGTRVERRDLPVGVDSRTGEITHEPPHRPGARVTLTDRRGFERGFSPDPGWAYRPGKSPLVNTPLTPAEARRARQMAEAGLKSGLAPPAGGELNRLKAEWNTVLDADPADAPLKSWWAQGVEQAGLVDAPLLKAAAFAARAGKKKLRLRGGAHRRYNPRASGVYDHSNRAIWINTDASLKFDEAKAGTFRHEFGHFLDTTGHLPVPRSKRRWRLVYLSSRAAKELREDHGAILNAEARAAGAIETAEDLYRHLGVDAAGVDAWNFSENFVDAMLKLHGGDEAAALLAIKQHEKRIAEWLKSRGVDFPYEELLNYVDTDDVYYRGWAAMRLGVRLAQGDTVRGVNYVLGIGKKAAFIAKNTLKERYFDRLRDYIGALTNERYKFLRGDDYYKRWNIRLFKTEVGGAIHEKNLAEGFANYIDMRYAPDRMGYNLAERMFPATTRRFGEILEEIGNGEHRYESGRDHGAENRLTATRKRKG